MHSLWLAAALLAQDPIVEFHATPERPLVGRSWDRGAGAPALVQWSIACDFAMPAWDGVVALLQTDRVQGSDPEWGIRRGVFSVGPHDDVEVPLGRVVRSVLTARRTAAGMRVRLYLGGVLHADELISGDDAARFELGRDVMLLGAEGEQPRGLRVQRIAVWDQVLELPEVWRLGQQGAPALIAGPLLGTVTPHSVELWAHLGRKLPASVDLRGPDGRTQSIGMRVSGEHRIVARAQLTGLRPDTRYEYALRIDGLQPPHGRGSFRTAPAPGTPAEFTLAVASCAKWQADPVQPLWYVVAAERPAFQLLLGDTAYVDSTAREDLWAIQIAQRRVPSYAHALRHVPTLAIWDDHDYGPNDSDGTAAGKEESLATWQELWANPAYGTESVPGVFATFRYGDVEVFLTDGRYHRSPNFTPDGDGKTFLGQGQLAWLVDAVARSEASFKLIANGSTWYESEKDGWRLFGNERRWLLGEFGRRRIGGIVFLSGDVHHCGVRMHPTQRLLGYRMPEVISSGIGQTPGQFAQLRGVQSADQPEWRGPRERRGQSFAFLDFTQAGGERALRIRLIGPGGVETWRETIALSQLQPRSGEK